MNFNKIILAGNITRDIEMRYTPNQTAVAEFGLAVSRKYTKKDGGEVDETCFVDVTAFGPTAETINKYLGKGDPVLIEGWLSFKQWEYKGRKYSKHQVIVDRFQFIPKGERRQETEWESESTPMTSNIYNPDEPDDIPFDFAPV